MSDELRVPKFATEEMEAEWWYQNRGALEEAFVQAAKEGRLRRGSEALRRASGGGKALMLQLPDEDLATIRRLADREGQNDEVYAALLLHRALAWEARKLEENRP